MLRVAAVAALSAGAALAVAGDAAADSIVFARDHNIWLADGVDERPLTTDGTLSSPYYSPTQSAAGSVVVAVRNRLVAGHVVSWLYTMDRQGTLLRVPFDAPQYRYSVDTLCGGLYGVTPVGVRAAVSPDGSKIAVNKFNTSTFVNYCGFSGSVGISEVEVVKVDGSPTNGVIKPVEGGDPVTLKQPSWASADRLLLHTGIDDEVVYYDLGSDRASPWLASSYLAMDLSQPSLRGGRLATIADYGRFVRVWTTSGAIPAAPTPRCDISGPSGSTMVEVTMAPDGAAVAWVEEDRNSSGQPTATAIYVSPIGDISTGDCDSLDRHLLIAGGSDPDWGAAPIGPAGSSPTLPVCPAGHPGTPPECGGPPAPTCPAGQVGTPPSCTSPAPPCPAGQVGTPPSCTSPATLCPVGRTGTPPDCIAPSSSQPPPAPPGGGASGPGASGPPSRTIQVSLKLRRGCSRRLLRVSGRGVTVGAARRLPRSRCRLTLTIAAGMTGRRDLLVTRGKRTTRLRGVIRL